MSAIRLESRNPLTSADWLVTFVGVEGYFSKLSAVGWETSRPDYSDGLTSIKRKAGSGTTNYKSATAERSFDPEKDGSLIEFCEEMRCSRDTFEVIARPVKRCNGVEQIGTKAWRMTGCRLESFETSDIDTGDGENVAMIKVGWTVEQLEWA